MSKTLYAPAEVFCLAEFLCDELTARGWQTEDAAVRMNTSNGAAMDLFCLDLLVVVQDDGLIIEDEMFEGLGRAFDVSPDFLRNLHAMWKRHPECRSPFECPESVFGPTSRRACLRIVPSNSAQSSSKDTGGGS